MIHKLKLRSLYYNEEYFIDIDEDNFKHKIYLDLKEVIDLILDTLNPRDKSVLTLRFGLNNGRDHTFKEIGKIHGVNTSVSRQLVLNALRKLRRPQILCYLIDFYNDETIV